MIRNPCLRNLIPPLGLLTLACGILACRSAEAPPGLVDENAYIDEIETWRAEREAGLRRDDSWLTLVGLYWLDEGQNTCGSGDDNTLVFPDGAPEKVGTFFLADGEVELVAANGIELLVDGTPRDRAVLRPDTEGAPTLLEVDSFQFYLIERTGRLGIRLKDRQSPALNDFQGLDSFAADSAWRLEGRFVPYDPPKTISVPNVLGTPTDQPCPGTIEFDAEGRSYRLDAMPGGEDELFIVFGDTTNGHETYGGGRFLYTAWPTDGGPVILDFNKAYNPPCVFTPYATCPLPPPQNRLELAIRAGEKMYDGGVH